MTAADMVDWELAISVASRLAGPGPEVSRSEADAVVAELREDAARSTSLVREYTGLVAADATAPAPRRRPAGLDPRQHRELRPVAHPLRRQGHREEGSAERVHQGPGVAGHGGRDRCRAGLPRRQGARAVRPVPRAVGPVAARRAQHRPRRARARRRPHRLPALGLPARGDPPRAVHRGAVDARPPLRADRPAVRRHRADPARSTTASRASPRRSRASPRGACSTSSARPSSARSWTTSPA